jgi:hypothetical protein
MMDPRDIGPPQRLLQARLLELQRERWRRVCRGNPWRSPSRRWHRVV